MSDLITNGDFEIGSSSTNAPGANASLGLAAGDTTMQGWTVVGGTANRGLIWAGSGAYGLTAYPGTTDFLDLTGNLDQQPDFGVEQTITTVPGQTYALTFEVGVSLGYDPGVVAVSVMAGNLNTTVTGLAATGTSTWDPVTIDFTATSTASTILIQGDSPGEYIGLDDVAVATTTNAAPPANLVANGSFEQATVPNGLPGAGTGTPLAGGSTAIAGWTVTGTSDLVWIADNASAAQSTPFGDYFLNLAGNHALNSNYLGGAPYDGVTQTIATVPGTTYQLTFDLGNDNTSANTGLLPTGNGIAEPSGSGAMPGWTVIGGTAVGNDGLAWLSNANSYGPTAETGSYFVSLAGYHDNTPYFGVSQTVATTVGQTYALTFWLGVDNSNVNYSGPIGVSVTAGPVTQTIENVSPSGPGNQWVEETVDFTAISASSTISIQGVQGDQYIGLDNVSLVQTGNGATGTNLITNGDFAAPSINPVGVSVTAGSMTTTFNNVAPTAPGNTWTPETLDFTATSTTTTISFQGDQGQNYIGLDNVVVSIPAAPSSPTGGVFSEDGAIDTFTVPTSGTYVITAIGATGGGLATGYTGGAGAEVEGTFTLTAGDVLQILVGGVGSGQDGGAGSGGGGSFVFDATTDTLLEAAGGGGGASAGSGGTASPGGPGEPGQAGTSGTAGANYVNGAGTSFGGAGGTAGSGGAAGTFVDSAAGSGSGGGGGGFDSAGGDGEFGDGGASFLAGGAGGIGASLDTQHNGGFGGGGGANTDSIGAGGGGGYSGGGGGEDDVGGGGGSFVAPVATDVTLTGGENADGNGSVTIALAAGAVSCYCCGTQICTDRGEVAVEDLAIGDIVLTVSGAERPIKWIGRRSYGARFVMGRSDILPICIRAGALDDKVPKRDLRISPNHAMYFENMHREGVLIEARDLVNGVSIVRVEQVEKVEYFHVELDSHDVIIAEGAFSESFIDDDSRGMFHNAHEYSELYANAAPAVARYCAPRLDQGYELEMVWRRLARRAGLAPSDERTRASDLHGSLDRVTPCIIEGWAQNPDHPEAPVCLDIFAGGQLIGQVLANCYREDLKRAGIGSGHHSFTFAPPARLAFAPDAVEVRRSLDGIALELTGRARRMVGPKQRRTRTGIPR